MRASLKTAVDRVIAPALVERGWSVSYDRSDVWFERSDGQQKHQILFRRLYHIAECRGLTVTLYNHTHGVHLVNSVRLASIVSPMISLTDRWHYDTQDELEEWLRFLLPYVIDVGIPWLGGERDPDLDIRIRKLNKEMELSLLGALGCPKADLDLYSAGNYPSSITPTIMRWEKVRLPWFKSFLAGEKVDPPKMRWE